MKKIVPLVALLAAVSIGVSASPQTTFEKGQWEVNAGMWDAKARSSGFKSGGEWDFNGGVTYGLSDRTAVQFQYYNLDTDNTGGESMEFNYIYSLRPDVAAYAGYNRVSMTGLPSTLFGKTKRENSIFQIGLIGRKHLNEDLDLYGKVALGTDSTTIWEAGLNYEIDDNLDVNAGYRYMNTEAGPDRNMS